MFKKRIFPILLLIFLLLPNAAAASSAREGLHGVWVSTVYNIDYPSNQGLSVEQLQSEADTILDDCVAMGLNAIFLQVRPMADSLYPSEVFPWSKFISGCAGQAPADDFDPLAYWVKGAHKRGLELHAWLNPYRVGPYDLDTLPLSSPARQHPEWVVEYDGGNYFDPGIPSVQQLVVDGAVEIVKNYDVDGIHLDDYFYPGTDFNDGATYARYGEDFDNIDDWRRNNVNTLVATLDETLHKLDPKLSFGISPAGIWNNQSDDPRGSATRGRSSYAEIYCDSLKWIEDGTVDYICPQLYWSIGYKIADFSILTDWWEDAVSTSDVALYIGMGAYRMDDAEPGDTWYGSDELARQLALIHDGRDIQGEIYFSYASLKKSEAAQTLLKQTYESQEQPHSDRFNDTGEPELTFGLIDTLFRFVTALFQF